MNHQMKIFLSDGFGGADLMEHVMYKTIGGGATRPG
jgi:hypothetical protein